jgi:hypothetical protein
MVDRVFGIWARDKQWYQEILVRSSPYFTYTKSDFKWQESRKWNCESVFLNDGQDWALLADTALTIW